MEGSVSSMKHPSKCFVFWWFCKTNQRKFVLGGWVCKTFLGVLFWGDGFANTQKGCFILMFWAAPPGSTVLRWFWESFPGGGDTHLEGRLLQYSVHQEIPYALWMQVAYYKNIPYDKGIMAIKEILTLQRPTYDLPHISYIVELLKIGLN